MTNSMVILMLFLIISSVVDIKEKKISVVMCGIFFIMGIIFNFVWNIEDRISVLQIIISVIPGLLFMLMALLSRQKIGTGDGMAVIIMGIYLGIEKLMIAIMSGLIMSSIFSMILIVFRKVGKNYEIPFIPFLTIGTVLSFIA